MQASAYDSGGSCYTCRYFALKLVPKKQVIMSLSVWRTVLKMVYQLQVRLECSDIFQIVADCVSEDQLLAIRVTASISQYISFMHPEYAHPCWRCMHVMDTTTRRNLTNTVLH